MGVKVRINIDSVQKMLVKRKLNTNGEAQRFFTHEVRRLCDPYVPMDTGVLKNTAREQVDRIIYGQPYAKKQYLSNRGGNGLRGKQWARRMWADRGNEIVNSVARFSGGKAE